MFPWCVADKVVACMDPDAVVAFALACSDARAGVNMSTAERILSLARRRPMSYVVVTAAKAAAGIRSLALFLKVFDQLGEARLYLGDAVLASLRLGFTGIYTWARQRDPAMDDMLWPELRTALVVGRCEHPLVTPAALRRELLEAVRRGSPRQVAELLAEPVPSELLEEAQCAATRCANRESVKLKRGDGFLPLKETAGRIARMFPPAAASGLLHRPLSYDLTEAIMMTSPLRVAGLVALGIPPEHLVEASSLAKETLGRGLPKDACITHADAARRIVAMFE